MIKRQSAGKKTQPKGKAARKLDQLFGRALALHRNGDFEGAARLYRQVLDGDSGRADALMNLGLVLKALGRFKEAEPLCRKAVELSPGNAVYRHNLGNLFTAMGRYRDAADVYGQALERDSGYADAYRGLSEALRLAEAYTEAEEAARRGLGECPDDPALLLNLANAQLGKGELENAEATYRRLLEQDPNDVSALVNLATLFKQRGDFDAAFLAYEKVVESAPHLGFTYANAVGLKKFEVDHPWFSKLRDFLAKPGLSLNDRLSAHFALAKMRADIGEHDEAFAQYRQGNEVRKERARLAGRGFAIENHRSFINRIIAAFPAGEVERLRDAGLAGDPSQRPVFVFGMPRSGTTLTEQIIATHSQGCGAGELQLIPALARSLQPQDVKLGYPEAVRATNAEQLSRKAADYLKGIQGVCGDAARVVDKLPGNYLYLGLIALLFPNAKLIDCRRHPIDNCLSCYTHNFATRNEYTDDLEHLGFVYREYERLMAHWHTVLPGRIHTQSYEEMVSDPEVQARKLIAFCGLAWEPEVLQFHSTKRSVATASSVQVRQPLYRSAVGRWQRYETHLSPLIEALRRYRSENGVEV